MSGFNKVALEGRLEGWTGNRLEGWTEGKVGRLEVVLVATVVTPPLVWADMWSYSERQVTQSASQPHSQLTPFFSHTPPAFLRSPVQARPRVPPSKSLHG